MLQPFLAEHFGSRPSASETANQAAVRVLKRACLTCHGSDLIEEQRLTRAGWTREVEKMVRWGAVLSQADKELLIADLSVQYGAASKPAR